MPTPTGEHFPEPAFSVPLSPTFAHPPAPQNIIIVGTPGPVTPVMPPPGQLQGPSPEPVITHPPPMMGTFGGFALRCPPMSMPGATGLPIVIQPAVQFAQPMLPSPLPSRGTPVSFHKPIVHSPGHGPLPSGQVFQPTYDPPIIEHGSPPIQAYPDPMVVSLPTR